MSIVWQILIVVALAAVVIVLVRGLINLMRGGSGVTSNKLMQARVALQAVALVIIMLALWYSRHKG
jgi:Hypoxia induced protein conserved region